MLNHQTVEKLYEIGLKAMGQALREHLEGHTLNGLTPEELVGVLVDRQWTYYREARLKRRLKAANLKVQPCVEDIDYRHPRGLDRAVMQDLVHCRWVRAKSNLILCGPTGLGKTWLANALAHRACQDGFTAHYARVPRLVNELAIARTDGTYLKTLMRLAKFDVLILDDWALKPLEGDSMHSILEVIDDRAGTRSTVLTSQLPVGKWHSMIADPTVADSIMDRLLAGAVQIHLKGESMRSRKAPSDEE